MQPRMIRSDDFYKRPDRAARDRTAPRRIGASVRRGLKPARLGDGELGEATILTMGGV
jgi:hypothetical protein